MAGLATLFWVLNALLALFGVETPLVYLVTFNLAFATYAFVDVVCDALMVIEGRKAGRVGSFVNFQWAILALANAVSVYIGGWFEGRIQEGVYAPWLIFLLTGLPPLATVTVGLRNIDEERVPPGRRSRRNTVSRKEMAAAVKRGLRWIIGLPSEFRNLRREHRHMWLLVLFIFFWKFSPSIGFIERSYLIDVRGFSAEAFGTILAVGAVAFFASVLAYSWIVRRFPHIAWYQYLYAMVGLGILTFPLSFFLYLDPGHPWWHIFDVAVPAWLNPLPQWNRYEWFRLMVQSILGFASIPAFIIPLTIAGETISVAAAGVSYAFLMSLSNATNMFEGVVGAGLYKLFSSPVLEPLVRGFQHTFLNIAGTADERTLILQMFVYISLFFTMLTIPFVELLRRELIRRQITINLGRKPE
jgi:hypothetical protein